VKEWTRPRPDTGCQLKRSLQQCWQWLAGGEPEPLAVLTALQVQLVAGAGVPERLGLRGRLRQLAGWLAHVGGQLRGGVGVHAARSRIRVEWHTVLPPWPLTSASRASGTCRSGGWAWRN